MKNAKAIIGIILILLGFITILCCAVWAIVFHIQNPDMTEMRMLIENPYPTIFCVIGYVVGRIGLALANSE